MTMDWLTKLFMGKAPAKTEEQKAKQQGSKKHGQRFRARERELRRQKDNNGAKKASFFWGSPGQTFQNNVRRPGEGA